MFKKLMLALAISCAIYSEGAHAMSLVCSNSIYENIFSGRTDLPMGEWVYLGQLGQWDCEPTTAGDHNLYRASFGGLSMQVGYSSSAVAIACTGKNPEGTYVYAGGSCSVGVGCTAKFSVKASISDPSVCIISGMKFGFETPGVHAGILKIKRLR